MKIEKLNDHQIRCTLTKEDLASRQIKLSELAYGSEKTKMLFRDMMQKAADDFGFETDEIPLMIEAIPLSAETIVLIISKVDNPDELDTRFSKFTEDLSADDSGSLNTTDGDTTDLIGLIEKLRNSRSRQQESETVKKAESAEQTKSEKTDGKKTESSSRGLTRIFSFQHLDTAITLSHSLTDYYRGMNTLYKDPIRDKFYLIVEQNDHTLKEFNRVSHLASEYMETVSYTPQTAAYLQEHLKVIIEDHALQTLSAL